MREWEQILSDIKSWVYEAGEEQIRRFNQPMNLQYKSAEIDIVTEVDLWTENFLVNKIHTNYPGHRILTEESGAHDGNENYEWVIDPIDGTTNFAHGFPLFCISIGVKYNDETVLGVVYVPKLGELYEAMKGYGAKLNGEPIQVSQIKRLQLAVLATGFPYDRASDPQNNVDNFVNVVTKVAGIRRTGSAAIDLCQVASGRFDGYWELKLKPWDIEAGLLIVSEAKGRIKRINGEKGIFVIVGNESIYEALDTLVSG
ncbi:inositol monophosphatase [Anaerobacillus alkaliphilus]|uniref:Inositol-1-monophosphatase n=1 Tax=Anaerobacillus alkaliphilus TaxID=1548597 RepID=A0A4Q0VU26_9BACI|nr:inositol monophosphatase family protein [Anaerobacillus alkaliphilus]RXJ00722.1 inositol monophosphatase [Anaerobacillus alkaliphilus]